MATSGQTLNDRINAARYALAGQGLARYVCKATTEEIIGPKKKHLDYLLACTHETNVSIPQLANLLIERTNHISWVVVFKALVTVHHLMSYGNERLIQYLASSNYSFELSTFLDKTSARDFSMSTFIRRYSRYINEKALSYRLLAFDFCKIKRGNDGILRQMPIDRLLKTLPILQSQLDALLEFDCTVGDLNNGVIISCFMLLFRDLIGLFACHNDGIINLLNKYFTLNKKMCREAFDLYKKFLVRMDKVNEFLRVAEAVGLDKDDIPDLRRAPSSLIDALEQHLQNLESNRKVIKNSSANSTTLNQSELSSVFDNPTPTSSSTVRPSSPASANSTGGVTKSKTKTTDDPVTISSFKDDEVRRALEEEARVLSLYGSAGENVEKSKVADKNSANSEKLKFSSTITGQEASNFLANTTPKTFDDIFGDANSFDNSNNNNNTLNDANNGGCGAQIEKNCAPLSSKNNERQQHGLSKPELDSIRSAIRSATTTLELANSKSSSSDTSNSNKKASDDLFNLIDPVVSNDTATKSFNNNQLTNQALNQMSPFTNSDSPFDLPPSNGITKQFGGLQTTTPTILKSGNPFPEVATAFQTTSFPDSTTNVLGHVALRPNKLNPETTNTGSAFVQAPNYTSLSGFETIGGVLQPTSTSSRVAGAQNPSSGKNSFASSTGLTGSGLFKGDLDSTLANLAQNLTFEGMSKNKK